MTHAYTPVRNGFAQSSYKDQQGTALAGCLAFASDTNLVDSFIVGEVGDDGLEAGLAVVACPAPDAHRPGLNGQLVLLPEASSTAEEIIGVVVRNQQMRTNATGRACHFASDLCNVARSGRSGARVWVRLAEGAQPVVGDVAAVVVGGDQSGRFSHIGDGEAEGTIRIPAIRFMSAAVDGLALVELGNPAVTINDTNDTNEG